MKTALKPQFAGANEVERAVLNADAGKKTHGAEISILETVKHLASMMDAPSRLTAYNTSLRLPYCELQGRQDTKMSLNHRLSAYALYEMNVHA